ncbi:coiled-coil domain-containing protein mad1, partial [Nowakowskiella sp. JEL0078]
KFDQTSNLAKFNVQGLKCLFKPFQFLMEHSLKRQKLNSESKQKQPEVPVFKPPTSSLFSPVSSSNIPLPNFTPRFSSLSSSSTGTSRFSASRNPPTSFSGIVSTPSRAKDYDDLVSGLETLIQTSGFTDSIKSTPKSRVCASIAFDESPSKLSESSVDTELVEARKQIKSLKKELRDTKLTSEKKLIDLEKQNGMLELLYNESVTKNEQELQSQISNLRTENSNLNIRHLTLTDENDKQTSDYSRNIRSLQSQIVNLEERVNEGQRQIQKQLKITQNKQEELSEAQQRLIDAEEKIRNLQYRGADLENLNTIKNQFKDQVQYIKNLEIKHQTLLQRYHHYKNLYENVEKLKEANMTLQIQLNEVNTLREMVAHLQVENDSLKGEKSRWTSFFENNEEDIGADSVFTFSKLLASQRFELATLKLSLGDEIAKRKSMENYIELIEKDLTNTKNSIDHISQQYEGEKKNLQRLTKSSSLAQRQIRLLEDQLSSYEQEENASLGNRDSRSTDMVTGLKKIIEDYEQQLSSAEFELRELRNKSTMEVKKSEIVIQSIYSPEISSILDQHEKTTNELLNENKLLKLQVKAVDNQIGVLENALGRGEFDQNKYRILQISENPESIEYAIRKATLDALREENKALRKKIETGFLQLKKEDPQHGEKSELLPIQSFKVLELDCKNLKKTIVEKEKRLVRLKEVYTAKATEYRDSVFNILGFRMDFEQNGRIRLKSKYGTTEAPTFLLTPGSDDSVDVQLTGGSAEWRVMIKEQFIDRYIVKEGIIPACMAAYTMALIENQ